MEIINFYKFFLHGQPNFQKFYDKFCQALARKNLCQAITLQNIFVFTDGKIKQLLDAYQQFMVGFSWKIAENCDLFLY